ncbi:MAG TPA: AI-2E family transporter, partial [Tepidisphaeraceae bacterium]|nr:AI-2E family transporter [Tepidisphaeraceae bacterium]
SPPSPESTPRTNRWTLAVLAAAFTLFIAYVLRYVLLPFVIAGAVAYVVSPIIGWLQRRFRFPRWLAALAPFVLVLLIVAALAWAVKALVMPQLADVASQIEPKVQNFLIILFRGKTINLAGKSYDARQAAAALALAVTDFLNPSQLLPAIGIITGVFMGGVLTLVLLFYFLMDGPRIGRGLMWLVPPAIRPEAAAIGRRAGPMIFRYVYGVIIVVCYTTLTTWLVTRWALHLPGAFLLAIAVGLLEMVPVIGPILSFALIALVGVEQSSFWQIIGFGLFAIGLRLSIDQVVGPVVLGKAVSLPPPLIIFAFLAGGAIWGILGVVVAIPVAAIIKIIIEEAYAGERSAPRIG